MPAPALLIALALATQCSSGRCAPRATYGYAPAYSYAPACTAPPRPIIWSLADSSGQTWNHADPAVLSAWVASRNADLARQPAATPVPVPVAPVVPTPPTPGTGPSWVPGRHAHLNRPVPGVPIRVGAEVKLVGQAVPPAGVARPGQRYWKVAAVAGRPAGVYVVGELAMTLIP